MTGKPNELAVQGISDLIGVLFKDVAYLDVSTLRDNFNLASGGMPVSDRSIRAELANYLMSHFGLIYVGLIANQDFRETVAEAVTVEIALTSKTPEFVRHFRHNMLDGTAKQSKGNFVIDLSKFDVNVYKKISGKLFGSIEKIADLDNAVTSLVNDLDDEAKISIGLCMSNFMYLIRAFAKNELFVKYVKTVIHEVEVTLNIH